MIAQQQHAIVAMGVAVQCVAALLENRADPNKQDKVLCWKFVWGWEEGLEE